MALINCPNCGKPVSDRAPFCPHCGYDFGKSQRKYPKKSLTPMILVIVLAICAVAVAPAEIAVVDNPRQEIRSAEETAAAEEPATQPAEEEPYHIALVEQRPTFPGGEAEMYRWLAEHIVYPPEAAEEGVSGRVVVELLIDKDGSITNARIVRSKHPALDTEALRLVNAMPRWNPGRISGAPVKVTYLLPITFRLQ